MNYGVLQGPRQRVGVHHVLHARHVETVSCSGVHVPARGLDLAGKRFEIITGPRLVQPGDLMLDSAAQLTNFGRGQDAPQADDPI